MSTNVYALRLQGGKFYVGKSSDPETRILSHFAGCGSGWTKLYPPVEVVETIQCTSSAMENEIFYKYANKYGWKNVRGGSYSNVDLEAHDLFDKRREAAGTFDRCLECGHKSHWGVRCYSTTDAIFCYRCGRDGHLKNQCFAHKNVDNDFITDKTSSFRNEGSVKKKYSFENIKSPKEGSTRDYGRKVHTSADCYTRTCANEHQQYSKKRSFEVVCYKCFGEGHLSYECNIKPSSLKKSSTHSVVCYSCGSEGHYSTECYSKKKSRK